MTRISIAVLVDGTYKRIEKRKGKLNGNMFPEQPKK